MSAVRIPADALVLVGDGSKALFLRNIGSEETPELQVEILKAHDNPATRDQGTDRPGRRAGGAGIGARSAIEQTDWHNLEEARFASRIADDLYKAAHAGLFDKLVVVAPPATLGVLRKQFHTEVSQKVVAEVSKNLTGHQAPEIARLLTTH